MTDVADTPDFRRLALAASGQAAAGLADMLLAATEGPLRPDTPFADFAIEKLADATKLAIEASVASGEARDADREQLHAALCRYLVG